MEFKMPTGNGLFAKLRSEAGLTISLMSGLTNIPEETISHFENGSTASFQTVIIFAEAISFALGRVIAAGDLISRRVEANQKKVNYISVVDGVKSEKIKNELLLIMNRHQLNSEDISIMLGEDVTNFRSFLVGGVDISNNTKDRISNVSDYISSYLSRDASQHRPPSVPVQTNSAHFTISNGLIAAVPTQDIDSDENDYHRLESLKAPLLAAVRKSKEDLSKGNKPFGAILDLVEKYLTELDKDVRDINYTVLYAYGSLLAVAFESAEELIQKGDLPEFDLDALTSTKSASQLHGPFILSSKDGRDLVTDAERYERKPAEERKFQADIADFGAMLAKRTDFVEGKTAEFISDITKPGNAGDQFERRYLFSKGAAKNLVIVLSAGAVVASTAYIPVLGPLVAASLGLITVEAMKKSKPFTDLAKPIKKGLDDLSDIDAERLAQIPREQLDKIREFVIENQDILERVGGAAREMQWFRDVLNWVKSSGDEDPKSLAPKEPTPMFEHLTVRDPVGSLFYDSVVKYGSLPNKNSYSPFIATDLIVEGMMELRNAPGGFSVSSECARLLEKESNNFTEISFNYDYRIKYNLRKINEYLGSVKKSKEDVFFNSIVAFLQSKTEFGNDL